MPGSSPIAAAVKHCFAAFLFFSIMMLASSAVPSTVEAQSGGKYDDEVDEGVPDVQLGDEYEDYKKTKPGRTTGPGESHGMWRKAALYLPNRLLDFIDIFRFDVGVGPAVGGVVRLTKYGQVGVRELAPGSLRLGLRGRKVPVFVESSNEFGAGPLFVQSHDRQVGASEVGAGIDFLVVGAYLGVDLASVGDFFLGIFGVDLADDDYS